MNAYEILGIAPDATQDQIHSAYRRKARECHPDFHPDVDPAKFARLSVAYSSLLFAHEDIERYEGGDIAEGLVVQCVKDDWDDHEWLRTLPVQEWPKKGQCYTVEKARSFYKSFNPSIFSNEAFDKMKDWPATWVIWLKEFPSLPLGSWCFVPKEAIRGLEYHRR